MITNFKDFLNENNVKNIKWENIKDKIKNEIKSRINNDVSLYPFFVLLRTNKRLSGEKPKSVLAGWEDKKEVADKLIDVLNNYDIREYKELMKIYPKAFPSFIKNNKCTTELTGDGWVFVETT